MGAQEDRWGRMRWVGTRGPRERLQLGGLGGWAGQEPQQSMPLGNAGWGAWKMGKWAEKGSSGDKPEERGGLPGSRRRKE